VVDEVETTLPQPRGHPPRQNPIGRRAEDRGRYLSVWVLVLGALFQGGYYLTTNRILSSWERQIEAERKLRSEQHTETMMTFKELATQTGRAVDILEKQVEANTKVTPQHVDTSTPVPPRRRR
jgi:hypothetical protein